MVAVGVALGVTLSVTVSVPAAPSGSVTSRRTLIAVLSGTVSSQVVELSAAGVAPAQASASSTNQRAVSSEAASLASLAAPRSVSREPASTVAPSAGEVICASGGALNVPTFWSEQPLVNNDGERTRRARGARRTRDIGASLRDKRVRHSTMDGCRTR